MKEPTDGAHTLSEKELISVMKAGIIAVERGDYAQGYIALQAAYGNGNVVLPPDGLSHFGLCVAVVEKQTKKGAELCRAAIEQQFYDSVHFVNLVRLYIIRGRRKNAIDVLNEGLSHLRDDRRLLAVRAELGYREEPVVPFLDRDNPLNATLGKLRAANAKMKSKGKPRG